VEGWGRRGEIRLREAKGGGRNLRGLRRLREG